VTSTRVVRGAVAALAVVALGALSGCGGSDPKTTTTPTPTASLSTQPTATAPNDIKTTTTSSALPVPAGGPTEVANFPVPEGVKVKGPGPTDSSWQFDIRTKNTDKVLAFYRTALTDAGYTVQNDVNVKVGIEKVHYDIQFSGPAKGYIVADKSAADVFVLVESLPTS
jgi:maltose-binding protein MalE